MIHTEIPHVYLIPIWCDQLQKEYDYINWVFKLKLTRPQIRIVDVTSFLGQWDPLLREIKISQELIYHYSWHIVLEILKHEMAHQLVTDKGSEENGHGAEFKSFCQKIAVDPRFQRAQSEINLNEIDFESSKGFESNEAVDPEGQRLMEKIEKLLSLAQSSNQNEALAAMEKVNELYEKYNIDRIVRRTEKNNYKYLVINLKSSKVRAHYSIIASILMEHFFVEIVNSDIYDPLNNRKNKTIEIFGTKENLLIAEYVFHFLNRTVEELWKHHAKIHFLDTKYKRSFQLGLLHGFNSKLRVSKENRLKKITDPEISKSLTLLEDDPGLSLFIGMKYPKLSSRKRDTGRVYGSAYSKGLEDGQKIVIHKGVENSATPSTGTFYLKY